MMNSNNRTHILQGFVLDNSMAQDFGVAMQIDLTSEPPTIRLVKCEATPEWFSEPLKAHHAPNTLIRENAFIGGMMTFDPSFLDPTNAIRSPKGAADD